MSTSSRLGFVFISYKREEAPTATLLRQALVAEGFDVWWDQDLQCGQAWAAVLDEAVRDAACIITLWSQRAVASKWVRHEASQAIARDVYAPCRIELVQLESPYDRIQATDLIGWDGDRNHGGLRNLIQRVDGLIPAPVALPLRVGRWLRSNLSTLVASGIAAFAVALLWTIFVAQRADRSEKVYDCSASLKLRTELAKEMLSRPDQSLEGVCLSRANLSKLDLSGRNLGGAVLRAANLSGANLLGATLGGADLGRAVLSGARVDRSELRLACADVQPRGLPEGYPRLRSCSD